MKRSETQRAQALLDAAIAALRPEDVAIDCGANRGEIARALAGTGASVIAFEPDPVVFAVLKSGLGARPNVDLREAAVGAEAGAGRLLRSPYYAEDPLAEAEKNTICADALTRRKEGGWRPMDENNAVDVDVIDLPALVRDLAAEHGRVAVLKLDIEGMELPILERMEAEGLFERVGFTVAELHPWRFPPMRERFAALRARISARYPPTHVNLDWG